MHTIWLYTCTHCHWCTCMYYSSGQKGNLAMTHCMYYSYSTCMYSNLRICIYYSDRTCINSTCKTRMYRAVIHACIKATFYAFTIALLRTCTMSIVPTYGISTAYMPVLWVQYSHKPRKRDPNTDLQAHPKAPRRKGLCVLFPYEKHTLWWWKK